MANAQEVQERNQRKTYTGVVISDSGDKSIVIRVDARKKHPLYGKMITSSTKLHVHDENNEAGVGDTVTVMATRPLSKMKRWRLIEIIEKAK
ncbi:MAG: 30S ribosomal protein S17 [Coriobacteriia bacterium]|nr:30S ribosomal protein S17 [Coriobacteriia bacterium]